MLVCMGGPTGPQGAAGAQGIQGIQGVQGEQGEQGESGGGGYVNRGDPTAFDFLIGSFTTDASWRDLDLSSIIPVDTTLVHITITIIVGVAAGWIKFRKKGNSNAICVGGIVSQVANIMIMGDLLVACDTNRKIQYQAANTSWTGIYITVRGWFV